LLALAETRIAAHRWGIRSIHLEDQYAVLAYSSGQLIAKLAAQSGGRLRVVDAQSAYLPLEAGVTEPAAVFREVKSLLQRA
jgi:transcription-repair coupling factor (superfamily II helicase)